LIAVSDSLRFGDINAPKTRWIHEGVVDGIAGYGNPLGIPNIGELSGKTEKILLRLS